MTSIKELLKQPFGVRIVNDQIYIVDDGGERGLFKMFFLGDDPRLFEIASFAAQALNEKYKRDFKGPMRWIKQKDDKREWWQCNNCACGSLKWSPFCPYCGQGLLPPEENK